MQRTILSLCLGLILAAVSHAQSPSRVGRALHAHVPVSAALIALVQTVQARRR
jgi:hypothetical protein